MDSHADSLRTLAALAHSLIGTTMLNLPMIKRAVLSALREQGVLSNGKPISAASIKQWYVTTPIALALSAIQPGLYLLLNGEWIYEILLRRRVGHPLLWMVLWIAAFDRLPTVKLIQGFHRPEDLLAWNEDGQGMLWIEQDLRADAKVQEIVLKAPTVQAAAAQLQVSVTAIRRYMRSAQCLHGVIRAQARRDVRQSRAVDEIELLIRSMPAVTRSDIHRYCKSAVSWLKRWEPELLNFLLSRVPEVRSRQLDLFSTT